MALHHDLQSTISAEAFQLLRSTLSRHPPVRQRLAQALQIENDSDPKNCIRAPHCIQALNAGMILQREPQIINCDAVVDLYSAALRFCAHLRFEDVQTSTMIGILRTVHKQAMQDQQSVSQACKHFNDLMLAHSMHRPPWSVCIFSLEQMKQVTDWIHTHYLANFHCFLYVFTPCTTVSFTSKDPRERTEAPPEALPALAEAADEEAHGKQVEEQRAREAEHDAEVAAKVLCCANTTTQAYPVCL